MKCISCSTEIPPAWVAAIKNNACPACGNKIMDDFAVQLKTELAEAMAKMENNPDGLAGWLLSNYKITKIGSGEPTDFYGKKEKTKNQETINQFFKNAKVNPIEITNNAKALLKNKTLDKVIEDINSDSLDEDLPGQFQEIESGNDEDIGVVYSNDIIDPNINLNQIDLKNVKSELSIATSPVLEKHRLERLAKQRMNLEMPNAVRRAND